MAKSRKLGRAGIVIGVITLLAVAGYVVKSKVIVGDTAGAADSTAADSTAVAEGEDKKDEKKAPARIPVEVATVVRGEISSFYVTTATLTAEKRVDILAKIGGEVAKIVAEEGDIVKAGDVLARLDDREQKIALDEARINRDQKKAELDRMKSMHEQNLISEKEYGEASLQFDLAQNAYDSAALRYRYTQITAAFDGVVTERLVDTGEHITVGAKLFVLADNDPLLLTMYLPETELKTVKKGQRIRITPDVNPEMELDGVIVRIAPEVDQRTGTIKVTAETLGGGFPGSFVRAQIVTDTHGDALTVPRRSIVADSGEKYVFVAAADTVRRVDVTVGYENEEQAEILTGLAEGDSVVTAGVGGIREGTKIKVLTQESDELAEKKNN